jgi:hypothetical protein
MRNLFEFLLKRSAWIVFLIYVVLCFVLLFNNNPYQRSRYLSSSNALVSGLNSATTSVTGYFGLRTENVDLLYQNGRLQNEVIELSRELNALRLQLDGDSLRRIATPAAPDFIMAQVIRNSIAHTHNYITIDKGRADGICPEMGVVNQQGVVGIVSTVGEHASVLISVLNPKLRLSCKVKGYDYFGSLVWDGVSSDYALLEEVPSHIEFTPGDTIVTSGFSTAFPEGIAVGMVDKYVIYEYGRLATLRIRLFADIADLNHVRVLKFPEATGMEPEKEEEEDE